MVDTFQRGGCIIPIMPILILKYWLTNSVIITKSNYEYQSESLITAQIYLWKEAKKGEPQKYG